MGAGAGLLDEQSWQISSRPDLKRQSLGFFEERGPKKKNKMSSDMGWVPDQISHIAEILSNIISGH